MSQLAPGQRRQGRGMSPLERRRSLDAGPAARHTVRVARCVWGTSATDVYGGIYDVDDGPVLLHGNLTRRRAHPGHPVERQIDRKAPPIAGARLSSYVPRRDGVTTTSLALERAASDAAERRRSGAAAGHGAGVARGPVVQTVVALLEGVDVGIAADRALRWRRGRRRNRARSRRTRGPRWRFRRRR